MTSCDQIVFTGDLGNGAGEVTLTYARLGDALACTPTL